VIGVPLHALDGDDQTGPPDPDAGARPDVRRPVGGT
jgi:hypothetical protein